MFQLLQLQRDLDRALNVVFVPEQAYGDQTVIANRQGFLDDIADLVDTGYWQNNVFYRNVHLTNFFYMTVRGTVALAPTGICPIATWPAQINSDAAFADVVILVHTNTAIRDCRWGRTATSLATVFSVVVHESGHALFNLPDEYCCDGGYWEMPPVLYDTFGECNTDASNAAWRNCLSFVGRGTTWWRSEDTTADLMSAGGSVVREFGEADWVVVENVLDNLGTPTVPTVFAPNTWNRP